MGASDPKPLTYAEIGAMLRARDAEFKGNPLITAARAGADFAAKTYEVVTPHPDAQTSPDDAVDVPGPVPGSPDFHASEPPPTIDVEAEKRAAFDAGKAKAEQAHAAAIAEIQSRAEQIAQWDADRKLSAATDALMSVAQRLSTAIDSAEERFAQDIEEAVHALASARAGQVIDTSPADFIDRIRALAGDLAARATQAEVALNSEDLAALTPHLPDADWLGGARLTADATLARGDVVLRFGDLTVSDRLDLGPQAVAS